jgi:redox-sensitive bicupin YhaK (pirin superfamily)
MKKTLHRAHERGHADHGWLHSDHSFSFANYYNPARMGFGLLRVINDDTVAPGAGFGAHPHQNMEIISVPLAGALRHEDSTGHVEVIRPGDIQVMSAGTGIVHSEFNDSTKEPVKFLQIWVIPKVDNVAPRYDQTHFPAEGRDNRFQCIVSPDKDGPALWINQDAYFSLTHLNAGHTLHYEMHEPGHGLYCFLIEGELSIAGETLNARDAIGLEDITTVDMAAQEDVRLLCMEIPMR